VLIVLAIVGGVVLAVAALAAAVEVISRGDIRDD
jgi:hypothetical protein